MLGSFVQRRGVLCLAVGIAAFERISNEGGLGDAPFAGLGGDLGGERGGSFTVTVTMSHMVIVDVTKSNTILPYSSHKKGTSDALSVKDATRGIHPRVGFLLQFVMVSDPSPEIDSSR